MCKCDGTSRSVVDRTVCFRDPSRLAVITSISPSTYDRHGQKLKDLVSKYPNDFGWAGWQVSDDGPQQIGRHTDQWGCVWKKLNPFLGGQCVGPGSAERINLISMAIKQGMTLHDLANIEMAYCPAVSNVYDALIGACDLAIRKLR